MSYSESAYVPNHGRHEWIYPRRKPGFRLPAAHVIHTVGPVWQGGTHGEAAQLAACYRRALALAGQHGVRSIAFPCISTGVYGYPLEAAAAIAVATVDEALAGDASPMDVLFCCFSAQALAVYQRLLEARH